MSMRPQADFLYYCCEFLLILPYLSCVRQLFGWLHQSRNLICGFFMFYTYILYSSDLNQFYAGLCEYMQDALCRHNNAGFLATKSASDWVVLYTKAFDS